MPPTTVVFKANGLRYAFLISGNAYKDREWDIVRQKALEEYVKTFEPSPHLFWHGGEPIGEIIAAHTIGPFLIEISKELPNKIINLARDPDDDPMPVEIQKVWDELENPHLPWGVSMGFRGRKIDKLFHLFGMILKKESSSLPLRKAANSLTLTHVIGGKSMSEAIKKDRRNLWQQLFGGSTSKEIEAAMEGARAALDNAGVVRKEFDTKKVKGLVEDMQARIMEILGELTDDEAKRTALANTIAAELMGTATEVVDETMPVEEMQDNPEEDEEQMPMQMMELTEQVKALASEANDVQDEMKELIPAFIEMTGIVKELAPLASKAQEFDALVGRMEKMEKLMALAPRPASTDKQTVIENTELKAEIDKGLRGTQKVLGLEVKS